jgi:hypothetical protein
MEWLLWAALCAADEVNPRRLPYVPKDIGQPLSGLKRTLLIFDSGI